jgi:tRNA1Val (adenine37-N6)-methyltransferase
MNCDADPVPLVIRQPERGYRFSVDPVLLAGFAAPHCRGDVLDLGTGCGVLLLLLSRLAATMRLGVGVEIQESLCAFAEGNFRENGLDRRFRAVNADFRGEVRGVPAAAFGLVVANPPFGPVGRGRTNPNPEKEAARHEIFCTLPELFAAARRRLAPAGHFALVYPHDRLPDILSCARREGMRSVTLRRVHARKGATPSRVLVLMSRGEGDVPTDMPPLFLHEGDGKYCPEVESICRLFRSGSQPAPG